MCFLLPLVSDCLLIRPPFSAHVPHFCPDLRQEARPLHKLPQCFCCDACARAAGPGLTSTSSPLPRGVCPIHSWALEQPDSLPRVAVALLLPSTTLRSLPSLFLHLPGRSPHFSQLEHLPPRTGHLTDAFPVSLWSSLACPQSAALLSHGYRCPAFPDGPPGDPLLQASRQHPPAPWAPSHECPFLCGCRSSGSLLGE